MRPFDNPIVCLLLALVGVLPLVLLTPPFQVPDEQQHFYRSYQISELGFIGHVEGGEAGAILPSSLVEFVLHYSGPDGGFVGRPIETQSLANTWKLRTIPLDADARRFVDFSGAAHYSPLPYVPQAVAMAVGRSVGAGPLALFYMARLTNALAAIGMLVCAVRLLPFAKGAVLVAMLLPMALFVYASVSPDALVISSALLFTAIALRRRADGQWKTLEIATAVVCATVLCTIKSVYAPVLLVGLPAAWHRIGRARVLWVQSLILVVALGATLLWMHYAFRLVVPTRGGTSIAAQAAYMMEAPLQFVVSIARAFVRNDFYYVPYIGFLGWYQLLLPPVAYWLPPVAFVLAVIFQSPSSIRVRLAPLAWDAALIVAATVLVMAALYLYWTPIRSNVVEGVQGRYFLPLTGLAISMVCALAIPDRPRLGTRSMQWVVVAIILVEMAVTDATISQAYGVFS